ncbi:hypothetical protein MPSEU_000486700 [Mayamaea pseudoterrestris]|nr:hypothetical protein MPSEU_000486700 [Mayamaea pseudoterrestris]
MTLQRCWFIILLLPWMVLSKLRKSIVDMFCTTIRQPLNHFATPRHSVPHYDQRYCAYDFSSPQNATSPVFFYTGNESPLETYINHTGLIWQLAESMQVTVVFAEHRYEGISLPSPDIPNCLAYSSSVQAIADYARLIELHYKPRPVILFGGSYGGMLSAWMRMKYPHLVAGAIAASAPIWGLPLTSSKIDGASSAISRGLRQSYPPVLGEAIVDGNNARPEQDGNNCANNLLAAWPLVHVLGESTRGRHLLASSFSLCSPMTHGDAATLLRWAQSPWFDLAEGSFPYPSSYLPFALTHNQNVSLPAWPLQAACWKVSHLHRHLGVSYEGNMSDVRFRIRYGDSNLTLNVDWEKNTAISYNLSRIDSSLTIRNLLTSVRDAVGVWFNMTRDVQCYNLTVAPSTRTILRKPLARNTQFREDMSVSVTPGAIIDQRQLTNSESGVNRTALCEHRISSSGSWPALCCNEEMNLIITDAFGMGRDVFWPPSHPRGTRSYRDIVTYNRLNNMTNDDSCRDKHGAFGLSNNSGDPWSTWLDTVYGGTRIKSHSNIIFSNGLLDPWSAAGVYDVDPSDERFRDASSSPVPGVFMQNISNQGMIALIMELGGHHTDTMYDDKADPPSIRFVREVERINIVEWIRQWNSQG